MDWKYNRQKPYVNTDESLIVKVESQGRWKGFKRLILWSRVFTCIFLSQLSLESCNYNFSYALCFCILAFWKLLALYVPLTDQILHPNNATIRPNQEMILLNLKNSIFHYHRNPLQISWMHFICIRHKKIFWKSKSNP